MLVALVLLSLLIGALFAGSRSLQRNWTAMRDRDGRGETDQAVLTASDWLAQAVPVLQLDTEGILRGTFKGRPDGVEFVCLGQGRALPAGLVRVSIGLQGVARDTRLSVAWSLFRTEGPAPSTRTAALLSPAGSLKMRYFGRDAPNQDAVWHDEWLDRTDLPLLVSIEVTGATNARMLTVTALRLATP